MKSFLTVLAIAFLSVGCMEFNQNELVYDHEIIGTWSNVQWSESGLSMEKVKKLEKNTYGYIFNSNGTMIARQNAGWCGTPPIITADYEGTWKIVDGSIHLRLDYWGGESIQKWNISARDNKQVTVQINHIAHNSGD